MELVNLRDAYRQSNRIVLTIEHFARGYYPNDSKHPQALNVTRLFFVLENRNGDRCFIGDETVRHKLRPGDVFVAPIDHPSFFCLDDGLRFVSIQFRLELYPGVDLFSGYHKIWHAEKPDLARRLSSLFDRPESPLLSLELKKVVYGIVFEVFESFRIETFHGSIRFAPYEKLLRWMDDHCKATTKVSEFAEIMNLSRTGFERKFTKETGITPKKFFDRLLIARAGVLLRRPNTSVRETAFDLDFSSEYVFSRFFKMRTGQTPGEYRRQYSAERK